MSIILITTKDLFVFLAKKIAMKSLIKGQTIKMDNHHQGDNTLIYYDEALHLHKIMNRKPYIGAEVRLPLKGEKKIEITKIRHGKNEKVAKQLKSEINRAFKNSKLRIEFVDSVLKELNRKCTFKDEKDRLSANIETAKKLAHFFGLRISESYNRPLDAAILTDKEGKTYYLFHDLDGKAIYIGDDYDLVKHWPDIDWNDESL